MTRAVLAAALAGLTLGLAGCIIISANDQESGGPQVCQPCDDTTVDEIRAAGKMSFEQDKQHALAAIARREALSDSAQVCLVEMAFKHLAFENAKEDVLLALVHNPSLGRAGEKAILNRLDKLALENSKRRLLDAINARKA